ncbi:lamin tail domain-containing protein [Verrucomicrobiaceae bacterium 227]
MLQIRHLSIFASLTTLAGAQLYVDFNSTSLDGGPHLENGYQAFSAAHEGGTPPAGQTYPAFGASVTVTPTWPNTTDNRVRQFIDREPGNDDNWGTSTIDLLTDWMGCDCRTRSGGNGNFNGVAGTPTYLVIALADLPGGDYSWRSFHHDTENIHSEFQVEISIDGGTSYTSLAGPFSITDSTDGGAPESSQRYRDNAFDKDTLPSTVNFDFTAASGQEVLIRFAAHSTGLTHQDFFLINGFEIESLASASAPTDLTLSASAIARTAAIGTLVGDLTTTDPTPDDTFTYTLVTGAGDTDNDNFEISASTLVTRRSLSEIPAETTLSVRIRSTDANGQFFEKALPVQVINDPNDDGLLPIQINEFVVSNESGLEDGNGDKEDWIELFNPNPSAINLEGYSLTDDSELLTKWSFPSIVIPANGYLIVFASGNDTTDPSGNPHTNFRLSSQGEFLALVAPDGSSIADALTPTYPGQFSDISYGRPTGGDSYLFFAIPTPGLANGAGSPGVVKDTNFSQNRGFYDAPISLAITSDTPGATIRYTRDGSLPSLSNGQTYSSPITISTTTNVRAIAYLEAQNFLPTNVDTHTYIFVDDVAQQPASPAGWATDWGFDSQVGQIIPSDYAMDQRVVNDTLGLRSEGYSIRDALLDIPSVSITMKQGDFVKSQSEKTGGDTQSLYGTPRERFEKICSIEYLLPDGTQGFQEDCKIETHGNSSRTPSRMQKHSLRLTFSNEVGIGKLRYNLFPDSPVDEFNKLVLRACFTDSWALASWSSARYRPNDSLYMRDVWMKETFGAMGQQTSYGNFVHLYVNGIYFGLHNLTERLEDDFYADHVGGNKEDWEVNADLTSPSSSIPLWNSMISTLNGPIETEAGYEAAKAKIDVTNYADWIILHLFGDAEDWPVKNAYAAANAVSGDGRYRFNVWDQEIALDKYSWNRYNSTGTGMVPFQRLRRNEDFKMHFADRVFKHMFDGGALTVVEANSRFLDITSEIDKAIVAESARWGDVQASTPYGNTPLSSTNIDADYYPPTINSPIYFTREQHWVVERDNVIANYIPTLHDPSDSRSFINELRGQNLYPSIDPPLFSQLGGVVPVNFPLQLNSTEGAVYYTVDGSDPRLSGGAINPLAGSFGGFVEDSFFNVDAEGWTYLSSDTALSASDVVIGNGSYSAGDWKHPLFDDSSWAPDSALFPNGAQGPIAGASSFAINGFTANTTIDIGPVSDRYPTLYFRKDFQVTDASSYFEISLSTIRDDAMIIYLNGKEIYRDNFNKAVVSYSDFAIEAGRESDVITHNFTLSPGDLLEGANTIAIEIHNQSNTSSDAGFQLSLGGLRSSGGGNTVNLMESGIVKARTFNNGEWSALRTADFIVGTPAAAGNLVVSEIMYNPQGPDENQEFIELLNINPIFSIDLTDVSFTNGILYDFPTGLVLPPLGRIVIAKDRATFIATYGEVGINLAPGNFTTNLSNGGETLALSANDGSLIQSFDYSDDGNLGWPTAPDGFGPSLVLIAPLTNPNHSLALNWKASSVPGGSPGRSDDLPPVNPLDDLDGDGLNALAEYFFGTNAGLANLSPTTLSHSGTGFLFTFPRNAFPEGIDWEIQSSEDLSTWTPASVTRNPASIQSDGRILESATIARSGPRTFYRVKILSLAP